MTVPTPRTPHYKLYLTEADKRGWQDQYYENMRIIDSAISSFGAISNFQGVWANSTAYSVTMRVTDPDTAFIYECVVAHTSSAAPTTFVEERALHPTYWGTYSFGGGGFPLVSGTSTHADVPASVTSVILSAASPVRTGVAIYNDSAAELLINLGSTASSSSFTVSMLPGSYFETPFGYIGDISGIWSEVSGNARVTEFTP